MWTIWTYGERMKTLKEVTDSFVDDLLEDLCKKSDDMIRCDIHRFVHVIVQAHWDSMKYVVNEQTRAKHRGFVGIDNPKKRNIGSL